MKLHRDGLKQQDGCSVVAKSKPNLKMREFLPGLEKACSQPIPIQPNRAWTAE